MPHMFPPFSTKQSSASATDVGFIFQREKKKKGKAKKGQICAHTPFQKQKPVFHFQSTLTQYLDIKLLLMQGKKKPKPNHTEPFYNFTKTLIPSVSPAEQMFQKPHPHATASLKSPPIQKESAHVQRKEFKSTWTLYNMFLQLEQGNGISLFFTLEMHICL